ncbi:MAG: ElyC/SanA/YdcF family protein [Patescibacteria group bacterium]
MARHIVIVSGYGCHLTPELKEYLDRVIRFCNEHQPDCLIFCGGFTNRKTAPDISEAKLMKEYVVPSLKYKLEFVFNEDDSYTTFYNIKNATRIMRADRLLQETTKLTTFCETTRGLKLDVLARRFFGRRATIETVSWETASPSKQVASIFYNWVATIFSPLAYFPSTIRSMLSNIR